MATRFFTFRVLVESTLPSLIRLSGQSLEAIAVPRAEWETLWVSTGDAGGRTAPRAEMVDGFNSGWIHFGVPGAEHVDGATPLRAVITQLVTRC